MRAKSLAVVGLGVLVLGATGLPASADETGWKLRFGLLYSSPTDDFFDSEEEATTELDDSTGIYVGAEFRVTDRFGVEPGVGYAKHDITVEQSDLPTLDFGETTWTAITVNGNFHLLPEREFDLYIGPTIGFVFWDAIDLNLFPADAPTDDDFVIGANVGIDVPLGDSAWAFAAALRYLTADLKVEGGGDIGVDPIQVKVGLSRSF